VLHNSAISHKMSKLVKAVGLVRVDHVLVSPKMVSNGSSQRLSRWSVQCSGDAANSLAVLSSLGFETAFAGRIGDDFLGQFARDSFVQLGCDVSSLISEKGKLTSSRYYLMSETEAASLDMAMSCPELVGNEVDPNEWLDGVACLVIEATALCKLHELVLHAVESGVPVVVSGRGLDADSLAMLKRITGNSTSLGKSSSSLGGIGLVISERNMSSAFSSEVNATSSSSSHSLLDVLTDVGLTWSIMTLGEEGAVGVFGGNRFETPAIQVPVVDCISAGDVFLGGFVFAMLSKKTFEEAMRIGHRVSAWSCEAVGARSSLPTLPRLKKAGYL